MKLAHSTEQSLSSIMILAHMQTGVFSQQQGKLVVHVPFFFETVRLNCSEEYRRRDMNRSQLKLRASNDTDLARDVSGGAQDAMFTYGSKDQEVWACFHGELSLRRDQAVIDKHWNPIVAAWYPDGKDDPHLTIIRFDGDDGRVWVSKKGAVGFFFEVAKANLTKTIPDAGGVADVNLQ
ncbi:MAG: hypothetical protein M1823_007386 [Watsoniomyces obsoletus]|nr:MAG: hypothetical protein M1823_007386 [Watsoniomyces obsoletus]